MRFTRRDAVWVMAVAIVGITVSSSSAKLNSARISAQTITFRSNMSPSYPFVRYPTPRQTSILQACLSGKRECQMASENPYLK